MIDCESGPWSLIFTRYCRQLNALGVEASLTAELARKRYFKTGQHDILGIQNISVGLL